MYRGEVRLGLDSASLKFTTLRSENSLVGNPTPVQGQWSLPGPRNCEKKSCPKSSKICPRLLAVGLGQILEGRGLDFIQQLLGIRS